MKKMKCCEYGPWILQKGKAQWRHNALEPNCALPYNTFNSLPYRLSAALLLLCWVSHTLCYNCYCYAECGISSVQHFLSFWLSYMLCSVLYCFTECHYTECHMCCVTLCWMSYVQSYMLRYAKSHYAKCAFVNDMLIVVDVVSSFLLVCSMVFSWVSLS